MSDFNIVFASDINYLPYTLVAAQSVVDSLREASPAQSSYNCSEKDHLIFHILIDDSVNKDDFAQKTSCFIKRNEKAPAAISFNIVDIDKSLFAGYRPWGPHATFSTYYRLLIDKLLPESVKTVLYLDVDILVRDDVRELFVNTDISSKTLAAVNEIPFYLRGTDWSLSGRSSEYPVIKFRHQDYFNAGVLLMNVDALRNMGLADKVKGFFDKYDAEVVDQDALNHLIARESIVYLDPSWNVQAAVYEKIAGAARSAFDNRSSASLFDAYGSMGSWRGSEYLLKPKIIHMTQIKPWRTSSAFSKSGDPLVISLDHINYLEEWRQKSLSVTEYSEELCSIKPAFMEIVSANFDNLTDRFNKEQLKRRKSRKALIAITSVAFTISVLLSLLSIMLQL